MKINKIKINSYGKLKDKEINLKDGINIVYGKNETGKSTLLRFIINSFYGISKNKKGKEYSDYDRYKPWGTEEFSGNIEYELNDKTKYEIHRDFKKKNPNIYNERKEDISKEFNIDKTNGNEFFYEQTKVDEDLFLSTMVVGQQEVKLESKQQSMLVQKIANLVGTGEDNVSFNRAVERMRKRHLDEIGTSNSSTKPINLLTKKIQELETEKNELSKYENFKYDIEENKNNLKEEILNLENENNLLKEIKSLNEKEKIEKEKIKIQENIKNENNEKINLVKNKIEEIKNNNKNILEKDFDRTKNNKKIKKEKDKLNKKIILIFILVILINVMQFIFIKNKILNYIFLLTVPIALGVCYFLKNKLNKKIKEEELKENEEVELFNNVNSQINNLNQEIKLLENNNLEIEDKLNNLKNNFNLKINLEKEKIKNKYMVKIENNKLNNLINLENVNYEVENMQNKINNKNIELHKLELDQKNIEPKLDNLSKIEEELVNDKERMLTFKKLDESFSLAKEVLTSAYQEMRNTVTPKFTQELSKNISNITNGKYTNVRFNDEIGLIVELPNGEYVPASKLSVGTIDQLYLSLRLSMIEDLSEESMPIILDESFAYFDDERLDNILKYINEEFKNHQVILFTCTNREKNILDNENIEFNYYELI